MWTEKDTFYIYKWYRIEKEMKERERKGGNETEGNNTVW